MQKLIAVPMARYNGLIQNEKGSVGNEKAANKKLNKEVNATIKNLENQDLLQREYYAKRAHQEMPEAHKKPIKQYAFTWVPPPPMDKIKKYKQKQSKAKKAPKVSKKLPVKIFVPQPDPPKQQSFLSKKIDLLNPNIFV